MDPTSRDDRVGYRGSYRIVATEATTKATTKDAPKHRSNIHEANYPTHDKIQLGINPKNEHSVEAVRLIVVKTDGPTKKWQREKAAKHKPK